MNIEFKTPKEIREHAEKVLELFNSTGKKLYKDIYDACQNELKRRSQKKSMEPSANQGQLPDIGERREQENKAEFFKEKQQRTPIRDAAAKVPQEIKDEVEAWAEKVEREANDLEKIRELSVNYHGETRVIGTIEDPTPAPIPVVAIGFKTKEGKTEIRRLTQTDILTLLKTYFKRVATSAKMESKRYSEAYDSDMGKTVYKLFQGWNMIYNETQEGTAWPPLADVFPGLARASQQHKINAEILWRWASNEK